MLGLRVIPHLPTHRVDVNADGKVSAKEMQRWIMEKTAEHFQEAVRENRMHFRAVDPDGDGGRGSPVCGPSALSPSAGHGCVVGASRLPLGPLPMLWLRHGQLASWGD